MSKPRYVCEDNRIPVVIARTLFKTIKRFVMFTIIGLFLIACCVLHKMYPVIKTLCQESYALAENSSVKDFKNCETSYIYDSSGNVLVKLREDKDVQYVEYNELPKEVLDAFIAIEDKRFFEHVGVDWKSTAKAAWLLIANEGDIVRGGSTITQQLARNVFLSFETSYERKIREIFLALALEEKYTKEQILEFYVNNINFGNNYYGIGAAASGYFGKSVQELSLAEVAFLCAIPNNPTYYNPRENIQNTVKRQNVILKEMYNQGKISAYDYSVACAEEIDVRESIVCYNGYAASYALNCAVEELMLLNAFEFRYKWDSMEEYKSYLEYYNDAYNQALHNLKTGGYQVYTTLDVKTQDSLQTIFAEELQGFDEVNSAGDYVLQGAATVIDNRTQKVIAVIGGREDNGSLNLNRAFQGYKQPGSTLKPLVVYTPSFEHGYNANTLVQDVAIENGPQNSNNQYAGTITLRKAVEQSKNVVAWQIFEELTPTVGLSYLKDMHFSKIVPDDYTSAASLGGLTYGVTTEEMCGGYSALANDGYWKEPTCISSIKTSDGEEVHKESRRYRMYSTLSANMMTEVLYGVSENGTASGLQLVNGNEFACKTGTTNGNKAAWFCGYTSQYTVAVYVGADDNQVSVQNLWGSTYPAQIWKSFQEALLNDDACQSLLTEEKLAKVKAANAKSGQQIITSVEETEEMINVDESVVLQGVVGE